MGAMKTLNLIICLLAVTLFVACGKKKDGNSNPYQVQNTPYGVTPNDHNGYYGSQYGQYPRGIPGYQVPSQANCQGPSQMFSNLVQYCGWLATDGERMCNPFEVRRTFMQYCQQFATRYNYCVQEVRTGCYNKVSGCSYYYKGEYKRYSQYSPRPGDKKKIKQPNYPDYPNDPGQPGSCLDIGKDCKKKNPKKSELICKLPNEEAKESNYTYSVEDYKILANDNCPFVLAKTFVTGSSQRTQQVVAKKQVVQIQNSQKQTKSYGNHDYIDAAIFNDKSASSKSSSKVSASLDLKQCMNIQKLHEHILNQKNDLSSAAAYYEVQLLEKNLSANFVKAWKEAMKPVLQKYSVSVYTRFSQLSALGANIAQNGDQLRMVENIGKIVECSDGKHMVVQYDNEVGPQVVTYTQAGFDKNDSDFEMTESTRGTFKLGNEKGTYILSRYIGVGKKLSEKQIVKKVNDDMKRKNYLNGSLEANLK